MRPMALGLSIFTGMAFDGAPSPWMLLAETV